MFYVEKKFDHGLSTNLLLFWFAGIVFFQPDVTNMQSRHHELNHQKLFL